MQKIGWFLGVFFWIHWQAGAQVGGQFVSLEENKPVEENGLSYGYRIKGFRKQEVKNKGELDRYEIVAYVSNQRACDLSIRLTGNETLEQLNQLRRPLLDVECSNATGARLTARNASVRLMEHQISYRYNTRDNAGKVIEQRGTALAGFFLSAGATVETPAFIVIVPVGEKPMIQARLNFR
ncbi:MAG: hypothetical protein MUE85_21545 [Microscillaceae bacterium]|jgi:hypothetical protein|nr:hypothetical protein [Microscillaceae bacterium]